MIEEVLDSIERLDAAEDRRRPARRAALNVLADRWLALLRRPTDLQVPLGIAIARQHAFDLGATQKDLDDAVRDAQRIRASEEMLS